MPYFIRFVILQYGIEKECKSNRGVLTFYPLERCGDKKARDSDKLQQ